MKTLLIDNGSTLVGKLATLSPGDETVVDYTHIPEDLSPYSLVILSGSSKLPVVGNEDIFVAEIQLIRTATVPIIGICLGHELIGHAFGAKIVHLGEPQKGLHEVEVIMSHEMFGGRERFSVYGNHQYGLQSVPSELEILARSESSIAVMKHTSRPVYGFQFHPEHLTDKQFGDEVFLSLFGLISS